MNNKEIPSDKIDTVIHLYSIGRIKKAIDEINLLLNDFPENPILLNIQGACYAGLYKFDSAIESYEAALKIKPDFADSYYNLGNIYRTLNQPETSILNYERAVEILPNYFEAIFNLAVSLEDIGRLDDASERYEEAIVANPDFIEARINLGNIFQTHHNFEKAINQYNSVLDLDPNNEEVLNNLGNIYRDIDQIDKAIDYYKSAIDANPKYAASQYNLGLIYQDLGQVSKAIYQFENSIDIDENSWSHHNLAYLKSYKPNDPQIEKLIFLLSKKNLPQIDRIHYCLALAKIYEKLGNQEKFFKFLNEGNSLRKKELNYSLDETLVFHSNIKKLFNKPYLNTKNSKQLKITEKNPIFILGMPRSGTSLVEQIISSHASIYGAGELEKLSELAKPIINNFINGDIKELNPRFIQFVRDEYLEMLNNFQTSAEFITDKLPLNFQYIGFILNAFPNAKIIHLERDSRATCWSNYKFFFTSKENGYSHDFNDLAGFYSSYRDLMDFWHKLYPKKIYNLNYENLTENQEEETKKLLEYLCLDWDENCLKFFENNRAVKTPSTLQVRKKMYTGSSNEWKKHWAFIQPLIDGLDKNLV